MIYPWGKRNRELFSARTATCYKNYCRFVAKALECNRAYYQEARPRVSDYTYDRLIGRIAAIERAYPQWVLPLSPTRSVGDDLAKGREKVVHSAPMLSMAKTYSKEKIGEFMSRMEHLLGRGNLCFCCELKLDGVAIGVQYKRGFLMSASTRGNGWEGMDITHQLKAIKGVPFRLPNNQPILEDIEFRGEAVMSRDSFHAANNERLRLGKKAYSSPRNATAGLFLTNDLSEIALNNLQIVFFAVVAQNVVATQYDAHEYIKQLGLPTLRTGDFVRCHHVDEVVEFVKSITLKRSQLPFDIDGIVIKVNDLASQRLIGHSSVLQRFMLAYKFPPRKALAQVSDIKISIGNHGFLKPVVHVKPIALGGITIKRVALPSQEALLYKDIRLGDYVWIEKKGDVIPQIHSVSIGCRSPSLVRWEKLYRCPSCSTLLALSKGNSSHCPGKSCRSKQICKIVHFASKQAMDIPHLKANAVTWLYDKGFVRTPACLYTLNEKRLLSFKGFNSRKALKILKYIGRSKRVALPNFLFALNIRFVGLTSVNLVASAFDDFRQIICMDRYQLEQIPSIRRVAVLSLLDYFKDKNNRYVVDNLLARGVIPQPILKEKRAYNLSSRDRSLIFASKKTTKGRQRVHLWRKP